MDEHIYTISGSRKQVDPRNNPIKETHIVNGVFYLIYRIWTPQASRHRNHRTGQHAPCHTCIDEIERATIYEDFVSAQHKSVEDVRDWIAMQERGG